MVTFLYVYFAKRIPKFVRQNIQRSVSLFPESRFILVTDASNTDLIAKSVRILRPSQLDWFNGRPAINQDARFWGGWWQKTFDRLFFIRPVHQLYPDSPLIQVETDVILFPSILSSGLLESRAISFPMYSAIQGVASIIYSPSYEFSKQFESSIVSELQKDLKTTDMLILGQIARSLGSNYLELFEFPKTSPKTFTGNRKELLVGFDGASHGEWICGRDPKAHWGFGKRRQRTPVSQKVDMGRYFALGSQLFLQVGSHIQPIHNLHVHSKEMNFFLHWPSSKVLRTLARVNDKSVIASLGYFKPVAFFYCLYSNTRIWMSSIVSPSAWRRLITK